MINFYLNICFLINIYKGRMTTDIVKQQLKTIMESTPEEDKQYLNEVKEEIKTKKDLLDDHGYILLQTQKNE